MARPYKVKPILKDSYLKLIRNSVGAKVWRNFYADVNGKKRDITRNGELSCAFFVSSVLLMFNLIKDRHLTIKSTVADMRKSGWYGIKKPRPGSILIWEEVEFYNGSKNKHIGFSISNKLAVSNNHELGSPQVHHITYGTKKDGSPKRKVEKIFWHKKLDEKIFKLS